MAMRNIVTEGDSVLNKKCREVTDFNQRIHTLIDDMRETLIDSNGVGLAAPQVGVLRRVVLVMDTNMEDKSAEEQIIELVNPRIVAAEGEQEGPEGCLSAPGRYGWVKRPMYVTVEAQDRFGNSFTVSGEGLTARAFCHELDHLEGCLFLDKMDYEMTDEQLEEYYAEELED